jgi:hypothetical protein
MVRPRLATRLLLGGIAGFAATLPMTALMRIVHKRLPAQDRYPPTPRELTDSLADTVGLELSEPGARNITLGAHYAYGAAAGALVAVIAPRPGLATGAGAGVAVWAASYLGWIPALGLLKPATEQPAARNAMMIATHLLWGAALSVALSELGEEHRKLVAGGADWDRT